MNKNLLALFTFIIFALGLQAQVQLSMESKTVARGEVFTVNCTVNNFNDIVGADVYVRWNSGVLRPVRLINNNTIQFDDAEFNFTDDNSFFILSWVDLALATTDIEDGGNLFTLEFEAIGADGSSTDIEILESIDFGEGVQRTAIRQSVNGTIQRADLTLNDGTINVGSGTVTSSITFDIGETSGTQNDIVSVPIVVSGFDSIVGVQVNIQWDATELEFVEVINPNLDGLSAGDFNLSGQNRLFMQWNSSDAGPRSVADGTEIINLRFRVLASSGTAAIDFFEDADNVTAIVKSRPDGGTDRIQFVGRSGAVTISTSNGGGDCEGEGVAFYFPEVEGVMGDELCVNFRADNYTNVAGLDVTFGWDASVLRYESFRRVADLGMSDAFLRANNRLVFSANDVNGTTLPDGSVLIEICFTVIGDVDDVTSIQSFVGENDIVFDTDDMDLNFVDCDGRVTVVPDFPITINSTPPTCQESQDGSILIEVENASSYTYSWSLNNEEISTSQNLTNVAAGSYRLQISDGSDIVFDRTIDLSHPNPIVITNVSVDESTNGEDGAIRLNVTGGANNQRTFMWSNGATTQNISGIGAGTYTVVITDANNCTLTRSIEVGGVFGGLQVGVVTTNYNGQQVSCFGHSDGSITVNARGGTGPYTYEWIGGASGSSQELNNLSAGLYIIRVRDADGTEVIDSITLNQPDALMTDPNVVPDPDGNGSGSIDLRPSGGVRPYTFSWDTPNNDSQAFVRNLNSGTYTVSIRDANDCQLTQRIFVPGNESCFADVIITPNEDGLNDRLTFNCIEQFDEVNLKIFDQWGGMVFESSAYGNDWRGRTLNGDVLADGAYFYAIQVRDGQGNYSLHKGSITLINQLR